MPDRDFDPDFDRGPARADAGPPPPKFCPRCGVAEVDLVESGLCAACGERLADQGYCPTCEDFWRLAPGTPCPKHDLELVDGPPPPPEIGDRAKLVTVATYSHPNQANAPRIRLEAEGIPTFLDGERIAGSTLYQVATGGVRLMVPADLAAPARVLIDQTWAAPAVDDDTEDAWDELAPEPGVRRRAIMKGTILFMLLWPFAAFLLTSAILWLAWAG